MSTRPRRRVILWDFDGTLARRDGLWRSALVTALDGVQPGHGVTAEAIRDGLKGRFPWGTPEVGREEPFTADEWWAALLPLFDSAYERVGISASTRRAASASVRAAFTDPTAWTVFDDSVTALASAHEAGWTNVVLSNHVPELGDLVDALGLSDGIDLVLTSAAIGWEKPHPRIFQAARQRAGDPDEIWMVGDNPVADITGAESVGIPALLVRDASEPSHDLLWAVETIEHRSRARVEQMDPDPT